MNLGTVVSTQVMNPGSFGLGFFVAIAWRSAMTAPLGLSRRAHQTDESPISYFIAQAVENPNLISLAAGLVDPDSFPTAEMHEIIDILLRSPADAQAALQYGTTQGHAPLREKIFRNLLV